MVRKPPSARAWHRARAPMRARAGRPRERQDNPKTRQGCVDASSAPILRRTSELRQSRVGQREHCVAVPTHQVAGISYAMLFRRMENGRRPRASFGERTLPARLSLRPAGHRLRHLGADHEGRRHVAARPARRHAIDPGRHHVPLPRSGSNQGTKRQSETASGQSRRLLESRGEQRRSRRPASR